MSFKTILCVVGTDCTNADVETAVNLAIEAEAHIKLLVTSLQATAPIDDYAGTASSLWIEERQQSLDLLAAKVESLTTTLSRSGVSFEIQSLWLDSVWAEDDLGERARYADLLLVVPSLQTDKQLHSHVLHAGLFEAMCPMLLWATGNKPSLKPDTVVLAWDSSLEASRAMRQAMPLLEGASMVHVAMVDPDATRGRSGEEPGADVALYLARHDVSVTVDRLAGGGRPVADVLAQHAIDVSADLIVMGGYGHSRLRERLFGGVTRTMTSAQLLPVFIAR
jgi:nucleotide-binding universal stress UspA family protein